MQFQHGDCHGLEPKDVVFQLGTVLEDDYPRVRIRQVYIELCHLFAFDQYAVLFEHTLL